jgi:predicted RNase H-like HicB family nuclease
MLPGMDGGSYSVQMNFNLRGLVRHDDEASVFVSQCPALGIYSQGETIAEAREAINSAVAMYLATAYEFDRLDQVLRRAGFRGASVAFHTVW